MLLNTGVNGLLGTGYILAIGGDLNGPTVGAILTIMGFSAAGKHARNLLPIMAGGPPGGKKAERIGKRRVAISPPEKPLL